LFSFFDGTLLDSEQYIKLMELFYGNLKEGMTKDKALIQAKLKYPYFWAIFIPASDMSTISSSNNY